MIRVYRWQVAEGRGPYRPGLSLYWKDGDHEQRNPCMFTDFGGDVLTKARRGEHLGCAFRTIDHMRRWFSAAEIERMRTLGYEFVRLDVDRVVAETARQMLVARRRPLRIGAMPA